MDSYVGVSSRRIRNKEQADAFVIQGVEAVPADLEGTVHHNILPYYAAKHYADRVLESSSLTYTIICPGILLNEPGTGKVSAAETITVGSIPGEDASTIVAVWIHTCLRMHGNFNI